MTEAQLTVTFKTASDIKKAFESLRNSYQKLIDHLEKNDEPSADFIDKKISEQSKILHEINQHEELEKELYENDEDAYQALIDDVKRFRENAEEKLEDEVKNLEDQLAKTDQSLNLIDKYEQGGGKSYYLDENI